MNDRYTISQLAHAAEIPTTTIRYYERIGLVKPEDRSVGNYRLYSDQSLRKLKFIRKAQSTGFTLDDVKVLLTAEEGKAPGCREVQPLIEERLVDVRQKLLDLEEAERVLQSALEQCQQCRQRECCDVIVSLLDQ